MIREQEAFLRRLMIVADIGVVAASFILSYFLRENIHSFYKLDLIPLKQGIGMPAPLNMYLWLLLFILPIWSGLLYFQGMYRSFRVRKFIEIVWIIFKTEFFGILLFGSVVFIFKLHYVSRVFIVLFAFLCGCVLLAEKSILIGVFRLSRRRGYNYRNLLIAGTGKRAEEFIRLVQQHKEWGLRIIGLIDDEPERLNKELLGIKVIGLLDDIPHILHTNVIDEVVFVVPRSWLNRIEASLLACEEEGIKATVSMDLFNLRFARARPTDLQGFPLLSFEMTSEDQWKLFVKRNFDIAASFFGLIVLAPLFLIISMAIKLTSKGQVFFRQKRCGVNGRIFTLLKFRTMAVGAEGMQDELLLRNEMSGPVFKMKDDPRVTPFGHLLRKMSIDELPQLINVFKGEMSIVGPRPPLPSEVEKYDVWQRRRLSMKPGLTCLWQISGRSKVDFDKWMELDLEYIDGWSLWLDFKILMKTIPVVIFGIGAR